MDLEKRVEMLEKRIDKLESENMKERLTGLKVGDYFEVAGTNGESLTSNLADMFVFQMH